MSANDPSHITTHRALVVEDDEHIAYSIGINAGYRMQNIIAAWGIRKYLQTTDQFEAESVFSALDIPISLVAPASKTNPEPLHHRIVTRLPPLATTPSVYCVSM